MCSDPLMMIAGTAADGVRAVTASNRSRVEEVLLRSPG